MLMMEVMERDQNEPGLEGVDSLLAGWKQFFFYIKLSFDVPASLIES